MDTRIVRFTGQPVVGSWVHNAPRVCGGDTRIRDTRYTVWGLVEWRQLGLADVEILRRHPDLSQADLNTAWAYYENNRDEIDKAIRANNEA
jgi:uncharacterized protein (DUF433 family)